MPCRQPGPRPEVGEVLIVSTTRDVTTGGDETPPSTSAAFPPITTSAWREGTITRAREIRWLCEWAKGDGAAAESGPLVTALTHHLDAAEDAAAEPFRFMGNGSTIQRAAGNLDAAEADLLNLAPARYVLDQMPSLLNHVQRHLGAGDPRRIGFELIAQEVGVTDGVHAPAVHHHASPSVANREEAEQGNNTKIIECNRGRIVAAVRGASSEALRERLRVGYFRSVLVVACLVMFLLAGGVALLGAYRPWVIPVCFEPQSSGTTVVVCPTDRSEVLNDRGRPVPGDPTPGQIDETVRDTVHGWDLFVVETIGLTAASVAAAAAIRRLRGSSEPYGLPVAVALLKMATGAITAFLGLLLMRGGFIPGSVRWTRPPRSSPGLPSSGTRSSCSPATSTSRPARCSGPCEVGTRPAPPRDRPDRRAWTPRAPGVAVGSRCGCVSRPVQKSGPGRSAVGPHKDDRIGGHGSGQHLGCTGSLRTAQRWIAVGSSGSRRASTGSSVRTNAAAAESTAPDGHFEVGWTTAWAGRPRPPGRRESRSSVMQVMCAPASARRCARSTVTIWYRRTSCTTRRPCGCPRGRPPRRSSALRRESARSGTSGGGAA